MSADFYTYCDHGIYYGWLARCQDCTSRGNVAVGTQVPGYGVEPRRPRLRDAAMWAAFVHELRAEVARIEAARLKPETVSVIQAHLARAAPMLRSAAAALDDLNRCYPEEV